MGGEVQGGGGGGGEAQVVAGQPGQPQPCCQLGRARGLEQADDRPPGGEEGRLGSKGGGGVQGEQAAAQPARADGFVGASGVSNVLLASSTSSTPHDASTSDA